MLFDFLSNNPHFIPAILMFFLCLTLIIVIAAGIRGELGL